MLRITAGAGSLLMSNSHQYIYDSLPEEKRYIQISSAQATILTELVRSEQPQSLLEIGTGAGYSTSALASGMNAGAHLISIEKDHTHYQLAQQNLAPFAKQITLKHGDARLLLPELAQQFNLFDFVFIDANKKSYPEYLTFCQQHLRLNGILVADNVQQFAGYNVANNVDAPPARLRKMVQAVRKFYETLQADSNFEILPSPIRSDLIVARRLDIK